MSAKWYKTHTRFAVLSCYTLKKSKKLAFPLPYQNKFVSLPCKIHIIKNKMANKNEATLSNKGDMTSFIFGNYNIRFRTSSRLKRYTDVKEWDNGYIVVMADYDGIGITEEYIDLIPILKNLYINPSLFLKPIQTVKIKQND